MAPLKNQNKISIKQVKGLQKNFLQHFFLLLFIFVLLLFGPILKYRKNKSTKGSYELIIYPCFCRVSSVRKHFSLDARNFSLFPKEGYVISHLISGPAWTFRLQFTKYQQSYAPMIFFCNSTYSLYPAHWIIHKPVYVLHLITCHGRIMPRLAKLLFIIALDRTRASICAPSFYLPKAYDASAFVALIAKRLEQWLYCSIVSPIH